MRNNSIYRISFYPPYVNILLNSYNGSEVKSDCYRRYN